MLVVIGFARHYHLILYRYVPFLERPNYKIFDSKIVKKSNESKELYDKVVQMSSLCNWMSQKSMHNTLLVAKKIMTNCYELIVTLLRELPKYEVSTPDPEF